MVSLLQEVIKITHKTHVNGGLLLSILVGTYFLETIVTKLDLISTYIVFLIYILSVYIGSSIPDIDLQKSHIGNKFPNLSKQIHKNFGHRSLTHSLIFLYLLIGIITISNNLFRGLFTYFYHEFNLEIYITTLRLGIAVGFLSHIILDMLNSRGVLLFYPITKQIKFPMTSYIKLNSYKERQLNLLLTLSSWILLLFYMSKYFI